MVSIDSKKIEELVTRSIDTIYPSKDEFVKMLKSGKQLRIYMGIDPTATYVHLGHSTNYIILRRFQELGHKIIVLIGDFTAMIGDPSDKSAARKQLTAEDVQANMKTFKDQIGKILDFDNKDNPIEFRLNSEWLSKLNFKDSIELASHFTVQRMLERDVFERRLKENKPLYVHEFFYPLMQGFDSVALKADVEIGGTDQTFNMLAGRTLVKAYQNREKFVISTTLLENPVTGEKLMSKSLGTGVGLNESPEEMYGKIMKLPDEGVMQVFVDCTEMPMEDIDEMKKELLLGKNPMEFKQMLAFEIVKMYHSEIDAMRAHENFRKVFHEKILPDQMPELAPAKYDLVSILVEAKLCPSKTEAKRVIAQGGVKVNEAKVTDEKLELRAGDVVQKGPRFFIRIK